MKTHFYFARDKSTGWLYIYTGEPKPDDYGDFMYENSMNTRIQDDCDIYKNLRPILSKIDPGKCVKVACDLKVVK